ncbi:C-factor-like [Dunckerocampus dactyliophorus]|uniref:C-factor-like n=1 Tax=Dunckerocampus dactyliophorus TaxID=161453 RepID=UPI00240762CA|nr:C-factor-like [Dunckerocampus dactyliophorus]
MSSKPTSVLITGANRGLGLELVRQMTEDKGGVKKLFACCREPNGPKTETLQALAKKHPDIIIIPMDVSDLDSIKEAAKLIGPQLGGEGLNLLINNAGIAGNNETTVQEITPNDVQDVFSVNFMGPLNIIKEFLPHLRAAAKVSGTAGMSCSKAAVINMSSDMSSITTARRYYSLIPGVPYRISKVALNMLTVCAAEEMKKDEILFAMLHPGWVRTEMGGPEGEIGVEESVNGMLEVMASMSEEHSGAFLDYENRTMPW